MPVLPGTPHLDNILVLRDRAETQTSAGIEIPQEARSAPKQGTIVALSERVKTDFPSLKVGHRIRWLYALPLDNEIQVGNDTYLVMSVMDVALILETPDGS
jgi:co-chaperonin GroES (HSP10)